MTSTPTRNGAKSPGPASSRAAGRTAVRSERPSKVSRKAGDAASTAITAADRAYDRRRRRARRMADPRLTSVGRPIRERLTRIPFVIVVISLLAIGGVSVLYLNTRTDETGMMTNESRSRSADLRLEIESLERDVAGLDATPEIARKAKAMGLVQAGDPAIIRIDKDGKTAVIGEPHPAGRSGRAEVATGEAAAPADGAEDAANGAGE